MQKVPDTIPVSLKVSRSRQLHPDGEDVMSPGNLKLWIGFRNWMAHLGGPEGQECVLGMVRKAQMSNWGTWDRGWHCDRYSVLLALSKSSPMLWFCKIHAWIMGDLLFPASLITKRSHVVEFWQMTSGQKSSKPLSGPILKGGSCLPSMWLVSPSLWLECDVDLSGLLYPPALEQCPGNVEQESKTESLGSLSVTELPGDPRTPPPPLHLSMRYKKAYILIEPSCFGVFVQ